MCFFRTKGGGRERLQRQGAEKVEEVAGIPLQVFCVFVRRLAVSNSGGQWVLRVCVCV